MASSSSWTPELLRYSSIIPSPFDYFTDSSKIIKPDLILVVGNDKFYCHRLLLSLVSPVFHRMFDSEFKEHDAQEVVLEGKTSESILELLKCIYPQFNGQITNENIEHLLLLADEYMIDHLKQPCKDLIVKQLQLFKFVSLPTQHKLEQPSIKSKIFHASDSALDSPQNTDEDSNRNNNLNRPTTSRHATTNLRHQVSKPTGHHSKSNDKTGSSTNVQPRYVLFLDKTQMPTFYDAHHVATPFTTTEVEMWLRRLRILYQIDKGRSYSEAIEHIISILQFIPASLLFTLTRTTTNTYSVDEMMLNDIARARMYILEEWAADGDPYRIVSLTESFRAMSTNACTTTIQPPVIPPADRADDEQSTFQETASTSSDPEAIGVDP